MMIRPEDPEWLKIALLELGVEEIVGAGHNQRILEYHAATTLCASTDEVPWCSSFVCWAMELAGHTSTASAASRSWLNWGQPIQTPRRGAICIFSRLSRDGRVLQGQGHVGFFMSSSIGADGAERYQILGGNQSNAVTLTSIPASRLLGIRWKKTAANSATVKAAGSAATGGLLAAAPGVAVVIDQVKQVSESAGAARGSIQTHFGDLVTNPYVLAVGVGLVFLVGGLAWIIRERLAKIRNLGV